MCRIVTAAKAGNAKKVVCVLALIRAAAYRIINLIETSFLIVEAASPAFMICARPASSIRLLDSSNTMMHSVNIAMALATGTTVYLTTYRSTE